jgi:hypothetical protein
MSGHLGEFDPQARERTAHVVGCALVLVVGADEPSRGHVATACEAGGAAALSDCRLLDDEYTAFYIHLIASTSLAMK